MIRVNKVSFRACKHGCRPDRLTVYSSTPTASRFFFSFCDTTPGQGVGVGQHYPSMRTADIETELVERASLDVGFT